MNGLALFAGAGGIELGLKLVLGNSYHAVCYVENDLYAAEVLARRMEETRLDMAPIWDDIKTFDGNPWCGIVDIVSAGFPCQPFSSAGKRRGKSDPRHLWPEAARVIHECKPAFVFLENVRIGAFEAPYHDLRDMGYWMSYPFACTAAELGAGHIRRRIFTLAYSTELRDEPGGWSGKSWEGKVQPKKVSDDSDSEGRLQQGRVKRGFQEWSDNATEISGEKFWDGEPELERLVHGIPYRVDRDRILGNAVVPIMAARAFVELMESLKKEGGIGNV